MMGKRRSNGWQIDESSSHREQLLTVGNFRRDNIVGSDYNHARKDIGRENPSEIATMIIGDDNNHHQQRGNRTVKN
jgi:hypothetical protein